MPELLILILSAILTGIIAWVYSGRLTDPGMIFYGWYQFTEKHFPDWIAKPLVTCNTCVSGQMGLWIYLFINDCYNPIYHIWFIGLSIFTTELIKKLWK